MISSVPATSWLTRHRGKQQKPRQHTRRSYMVVEIFPIEERRAWCRGGEPYQFYRFQTTVGSPTTVGSLSDLKTCLIASAVNGSRYQEEEIPPLGTSCSSLGIADRPLLGSRGITSTDPILANRPRNHVGGLAPPSTRMSHNGALPPSTSLHELPSTVHSCKLDRSFWGNVTQC